MEVFQAINQLTEIPGDEMQVQYLHAILTIWNITVLFNHYSKTPHKFRLT
jgi:hypothetical protein